MTESRFTNPAQVLAFIFAGNATFTLRSLRTGSRYTYKIQKNDRANNFFVKVLTGPDNTSDFTYIGMVIDGQFKSTAKSKLRRGALPVDAFVWALARLQKDVIPQEMEVWHTGRCGRCGRTLTVPESVATGIGPDCAAQMGINQVQLEIHPELPISASQYENRTHRTETPAQVVVLHTVSSVDEELARLVEAKVAEYRSENPEAFYQDGMLNEEEALAVARNKFRVELSQDDRLGSKFGELEAQQEAAYRRAQ